MQTSTIIALAAYFILMLAIGLYAWKRSTEDSEGYLLGGRNLHPAVAALSAGASDMSGWLLLGLPGALYATGLVEAWIGIGLFVGAVVNWIVVAPRLRQQTVDYGNALTIPEFLANRFPDKAVALRVVSAIIIVVFFAVYSAAGLVGGGLLFESTFIDGQVMGFSPYMAGVMLTALVVLAYTMVGGFLAVSLTDFVQGCIMVLALVVMPLVVLYGQGGGGIGQMTQTLKSMDPDFLSWFSGLSVIGFLSAVAWGLGYFGQPHIIVRFMAVREGGIPAARNIGLSWMAVALIGALGIGLAGRAYVERNPALTLENPETIFILLANTLFHPFVTGFLLAALLAAIMSTISSQLLVSSSSLAEDFYRLFLKKNASEREMVNVGRVSVALVAVAAIVIASDPESGVLALVANAWAGFGAAFGPLIILSLTWKRMTGAGAVAGLVTGAVVVMAWIALGWNGAFLGGPGVYEIIPGFVAAWLAIWLVSKATRKDAPVLEA
ncbi:proline: sodium symporter [Aurantiacibacter atlanticus]|uniref:Sodium/proline symporter n=1 Tax=Aurantiacibacter atlanticus TaxID=1648404 RepID=A0A0H4VBA7_9SPHN|nr:sodium/proline symporter PutP [Aurantiacibacter atlanticus]AKQ41917.1 proline: sodium symporter [Aurantiacibacter atlanticus]MDF1833978.1 sodium/proline symporter PutP [Alteraurantiacibacter sp. bin_em_oilr2.035]